jgi:hypothetical protein
MTQSDEVRSYTDGWRQNGTSVLNLRQRARAKKIKYGTAPQNVRF